MRVLVIGNGFISNSIINRLQSEGHELLVYTRKQNESNQFRQIVGDIFDFEEFTKALDWKPQIIIHAAWITTPGLYRSDSSNYKYAEFTANLSQRIASSDVEHLIILGTCAEYGRQNGPSTAGITKTSPNSLYAEQKVAAFNSAKEVLYGTDVRFTWARIFYPYGPNQDQKRLIPYLIDSLRNGKSIQLADVSSVHDWITTRDIASAISWTMENKLPEEVDIGTSLGFTNLELLTFIADLLNKQNHRPIDNRHQIGLGEVFVAGKNSPLFISGWLPENSLQSGLEWVLGT